MKKPVCLTDPGVIEFMEYCATSWGNNRPYPTGDHNLTHQEALQMIHEITEYEALQFA